MKGLTWRRVSSVYIPIHLFAYYLWIAAWSGNESVQRFGGNSIALAAEGLAAAMLFATFRQTQGKQRRMWLLLALGTLSFVIADAIWSYYELILQVQVPSPGWADLFYMLQPLFFLFALLYQLYLKKNSYGTVRFLFDTVIFMTVAISLSWHFIIRPIFEMGQDSLLSLLVKAWYPIGDLALLFGAVSLYLSSTTIFPRRVLRLILLGLLMMVFADSFFMYLEATQGYVSGSWFDPLWSLAMLLVGHSGFYARDAGQAQAPQPYRFDLRMYLPYVAVAGLFVMMVVQEDRIDSITIGSAIAILLLILRQIITLIENGSLVMRLQSLTEELERKVEERTREISVKNTQLTQAFKQMEHMAYHDVLTELPNRRLFEERLTRELQAAQEKGELVAVLFLDLDRFKYINDAFGHGIGDRLLQAVSERLSFCMRPGDTVSRQGGDEFTLLMPGIASPQEVEERAQRIYSSFQCPFTVDGQEIHITLSMGIALYPHDGDNAVDLMKHVDTAMYLAKESGKNNYQFYTSALHEMGYTRMSLENALHKALDRGEFRLHYQAQVCLETDTTIGVEALVRWQHPEHGLVSPALFIPLAEETGLIVPIGDWVLREACRSARRWQDAGLRPFKVGVNLSPRQFLQENLVERVASVLAETGLDPQYLDLEITESVAMHNVDHVIAKLQALKNLGVQISIDDFGTGYSSLSYLKKFPINTLKIAQPFVQDVNANADDAAIVQAIIAMAHSLNLSVIAEGVETDEQLGFLRSLHCDSVQGYLFSKPLPETELLVEMGLV